MLTSSIFTTRFKGAPISAVCVKAAMKAGRKGISQQEAAEIRRMIDAAAGKE